MVLTPGRCDLRVVLQFDNIELTARDHKSQGQDAFRNPVRIGRHLRDQYPNLCKEGLQNLNVKMACSIDDNLK